MITPLLTTFKTEFIHQMSFQSLQHLALELYDYVNWYNNHLLLTLHYCSYPSTLPRSNHFHSSRLTLLGHHLRHTRPSSTLHLSTTLAMPELRT